MLKNYFSNLYLNSTSLNQSNILSFVKLAMNAKMLDLGCHDGEWTLKLSGENSSPETWGIEFNSAHSAKALAKGIKVIDQDIDQKWKVPDNYFDLIHANQVIEHVSNVDHLAVESFRVLKPGGRIIISTENGSSWHNIFASVMGWQIFSLSNLSANKRSLGNPMAIHRNDESLSENNWTHKVIFNYLGLVEFFKLHGFSSIEVKGAGYYPLPAEIGLVDPRHAHFLTLSAIK